VEPLLEKVYKEEEVAGKEPRGVSILTVNCMRLIMPRRAFWEASESRERSRSTGHCQIKSGKVLRLKSGASRDSVVLGCDKIRVEGVKN
jgi:hypothetical protein